MQRERSCIVLVFRGVIMESKYDFFNKGNGGGSSVRDEDFDEEDVWVIAKETRETSPKVRKSRDPSSVSTPTPRRLPTASRMIPRATNSTHETKCVQQSAPLNIPDWSKIYRKNSKKGSDSHSFRDGSWADDGDVNVNNDGKGGEVVDEDDDEWIPPHEWIAKKLARSQISSFSVCEGVGRTLKGRDLSKVRNAVLTRTGFLE